MKILRRIAFFTAVFCAGAACSFVSSAQDTYFYDQLEASGANALFDQLEDEQIELLEELGINKIDLDSLMNISPRKIFDLFFSVVTGQYVTPLNSAVTVGVMIILAAVTSQFLSPDEKNSRIIGSLTVIIISLVAIVPLTECLSRVVASVSLSADFMLSLIPILATLLTVSGNPASALSYNSLCFAAAQFVSALASDFFSPTIKITLALSMVSSLNDSVSFEKIVGLIKKIQIFLLSFVSTVFITMLSLKGMLSGAADGVAVRGIRFLIGNLIPFVGGAVSDAYTSIFGTLKLVKNTVAVFAILAVCLINIPVFIESLCWIIAFSFLSMLSDMFFLNRISSFLSAVSSCLVMLTVLLLMVIIVFVLSIGLVILISNG